ncbi:MAG TPA: CmcI family methyltransferase [Pyrinomonadaceae bacterium]
MSLTEQNQFSYQSPTGKASPELLSGSEFRQDLRRLAGEFKEKIIERQNGIPTMLDNALLSFIDQLNRLPPQQSLEESSKQVGGPEGELLRERLSRLRTILSRRSQGRFVSYEDRRNSPGEESEISDFEMLMSQGAAECMKWKGMALFKTVYDFSIYTMMLWDLKPRTIFELGSGTGSSAVWFADLMKTFGVESHVHSVDLKEVKLKHAGVNFVQGNSMNIERIFDEGYLRSAPHPWLVIEDAHANVYEVLCYFHGFLEQGDYLVVEDSIIKKNEIARFMRRYPDRYRVDTYYTDFFGRNATCSPDSIFVKM